MKISIATLLITSVVLFESVESSSRASSSSEGTENHSPFTPDGIPLGPDEELIVHEGKVLTKANMRDFKVIPYRNESGKFVQYKIVTSTALRLGPSPHYLRLVVNQSVWLQDIASYNNAHKPHWIYDEALLVCEKLKADEREKVVRRMDYIADMQVWARSRLKRGGGL